MSLAREWRPIEEIQFSFGAQTLALSHYIDTYLPQERRMGVPCDLGTFGNCVPVFHSATMMRPVFVISKFLGILIVFAFPLNNVL